MLNYIWLVPLFPLAGSALLGIMGLLHIRLAGVKPGKGLVSLIALTSVFLSMILAAAVVWELFAVRHEESFTMDLFTWLRAGSLPLADGDELLLCSDGLWSPLEDQEIAAAMSQAPLQAALDQLMTEAIYRDGASADNTTVVAARIGNGEQAHSTDMPMCMVLDYR